MQSLPPSLPTTRQVESFNALYLAIGKEEEAAINSGWVKRTIEVSVLCMLPPSTAGG